MLARRLTAVAVALLLAVQVVRNGAVQALAQLHPDTAAILWATHPRVEISRALVEIASASRARRALDPQTFSLVYDATTKAPLRPDPFLVRGVELQNANRLAAARDAFRAAQRRDPRSLSAAYFLANLDLRSGDRLGGLQQMALLVRLAPNGRAAVAPFLASYAQDRANWPLMRKIFRSEPALEEAVLGSLAQDSRNADALLALASRDQRRPDSPWLKSLLSRMVEQRKYSQARAIWLSVGGGSPGALVFDSAFAKSGPPPPFNRYLATSGTGLAERQPGGQLHAIFYGSQDGVLASQLTMMPPGSYRLKMQSIGSPVHPELLSWSMRCADWDEAISSVPIVVAASSGWSFRVPGNCPAQWLELSGRSEDIAQQAEITIGGLNVTRVGSDG